MAHFAKLDENNEVIEVNVIADADCLDDNDKESETVGIAFCKSLWGSDTIWKQTSYNSNIRKNYAGIGYTYDSTRDAYIPPKPYNSWVLNETTCDWDAPTAHPDDGNHYVWNEDTTSWEAD